MEFRRPQFDFLGGFWTVLPVIRRELQSWKMESVLESAVPSAAVAGEMRKVTNESSTLIFRTAPSQQTERTN